MQQKKKNEVVHRHSFARASYPMSSSPYAVVWFCWLLYRIVCHYLLCFDFCFVFLFFLCKKSFALHRHCHILTVWSTLPVATTGLAWQYLQLFHSRNQYLCSMRLNGTDDAYDMHVTKCECASIVFIQRPVLRSQIFMVLSSDADNRNLPLGWTTSPRTQLSWPIMVCNSWPLASQSLMVLSREPVTTYWPGVGCSLPALD